MAMSILDRLFGQGNTGANETHSMGASLEYECARCGKMLNGGTGATVIGGMEVMEHCSKGQNTVLPAARSSVAIAALNPIRNSGGPKVQLTTLVHSVELLGFQGDTRRRLILPASGLNCNGVHPPNTRIQ